MKALNVQLVFAIVLSIITFPFRFQTLSSWNAVSAEEVNVGGSLGPAYDANSARGYYRYAPSSQSTIKSASDGSSTSSSSLSLQYLLDITIPEHSPSLKNDFLQTYYPDARFTDPSFFLSQVGQDIFVSEILGHPVNGFFVDLGANDFAYNSNSIAFEVYYNWTGLCIEPNPSYHQRHLMFRRCKLVVNPVYSVDNEQVHFRFEHELYGGGVMGGIVSESFENKGVKTSDVELTTVSLNTLLKSFNAPSLIQYLSLDLEGAEYEVMKTLDFEKYTFLVITVERPSEDLHKLLGSKGYWALVQFPLVPKQPMDRFGDMCYIHESIPNFSDIMSKYRPSGLLNDHIWEVHNAKEYLNEPIWVNSDAASRSSNSNSNSSGSSSSSSEHVHSLSSLKASVTYHIEFSNVETGKLFFYFNESIVGTPMLLESAKSFCDRSYIIMKGFEGFTRTIDQCLDTIFNIVENTILQSNFGISNVTSRDLMRGSNIVNFERIPYIMKDDDSFLIISSDSSNLLRAYVGKMTYGLAGLVVSWYSMKSKPNANNANRLNTQISTPSTIGLTIGRFVQIHSNVRIILCGSLIQGSDIQYKIDRNSDQLYDFAAYPSIYSSNNIDNINKKHFASIDNSALIDGTEQRLVSYCKESGESAPTTIGSDVYLGSDSVVMPGVSIGIGAVVLAGSWVVADLPAYSISSGNPSTVKGYRYSSSKNAELLRLQWWLLDDDAIEELRKNKTI